MFFDRIRGEKIVILYIEELGYIQYILPIVKSLKERELPISYYIATDHNKYYNELNPFNVSKNKIFNPAISPWLWLANIFLSASVYGKGPKSAFRVNISHNLPVKVETYPKEAVINYNVHFLTGTTQRDQYENMFNKLKIDMDTVQMLDIGYPKLDDLLNGDYEKVNILDELGLDTKKPTILYAPAWDPGASLRSFGEQLIEELLKLDGVNVIVKLHPVSYTPESSPNFDFYTGRINWKEKLSKYENFQNFRHIVEYSLNPLLAASDIMVSDVSSAALEFIILDKPVVYINCPEFYNKTLVEWGHNPQLAKNDELFNAGRNVGIVVEDISKLAEAVLRCINQPQEFSEERKALSDHILYNPGKGSKTAAESILELL